MTIEKKIELEYKTLLEDEDKFLYLKNYFREMSESDTTYFQTNFYFESKSFDTLKHKLTIRIREKCGQWELTAKTKVKNKKHKNKDYSAKGESNMAISVREAFAFIQGKPLTKENSLIEELIREAGMDEDVEFFCIGSLQTERTDYHIGSDIVSLDKSRYNGVTDFELEWETETNHSVVQKKFKELKLEPNNSPGKKGRFLQSLRTKTS